MSKRTFVVTGNWSWDHSNSQLATFTIEGDEAEEWRSDPLPMDTPLTPDNFSKYFEAKRDYFLSRIKKLLTALDDSIMGKIRPGSLYEVRSGSYFNAGPPTQRKEEAEINAFNLTVEWLCNLNENGEPIFN